MSRGAAAGPHVRQRPSSVRDDGVVGIAALYSCDGAVNGLSFTVKLGSPCGATTSFEK